MTKYAAAHEQLYFSKLYCHALETMLYEYVFKLNHVPKIWNNIEVCRSDGWVWVNTRTWDHKLIMHCVFECYFFGFCVSRSMRVLVVPRLITQIVSVHLNVFSVYGGARLGANQINFDNGRATRTVSEGYRYWFLCLCCWLHLFFCVLAIQDGLMPNIEKRRKTMKSDGKLRKATPAESP